jgi:hypothetical protein
LLEWHLEIVFQNLSKDLSADQRSGRGYGWDDLAGLEFDLVCWEVLYGIVGGPEVTEE